MVVIRNPLVLPVLVLLWSIDAWLWLASIRLVLFRVHTGPAGRIGQGLAKITDPLPGATGQCIRQLTTRQPPLWLTWLLTVFAVVAVRSVVVSVLVSVQAP